MTEGGALGIKGTLVKRVRDALLLACQTNVDKDDPTYAAVVDVGAEYTGEIDLDRVVILSLDSQPKKPEGWIDATGGAKDDLGFEMPDMGHGMTGAKKFTPIRGSVQIRFNLSGNNDRPQATAEEAMEIRQTVVARARHALDTDSNLVGFFDDYGAGVHIFNMSRVTGYDLQGGNHEVCVDWAALVTVPTRQRSLA